MFRVLLIIFSLLRMTNLLAFVPASKVLKYKKIFLYTPHLFNPKFTSFEFGFVSQKKIKSYHYNAFAKGVVAEEFYSTNSELRAGALGAKIGVFLPTQPWMPIFLEIAIGYAKTGLHKDPWFGDRDESVHSKSLLLQESGIVYLYKEKVIYRVSYQYNNVDYFTRKIFFSIGINY